MTSGIGGGHCLITGAKATAGAYANTTLTLSTSSFKGAMSIALKPAILVTGVTVNPTTATILAGGAQTIAATASPSTADDRNVNWTLGAGCDASDSVSPATTLGDGTASTTFTAGTTGTLPRTCQVTATAADGSGFWATSSITIDAGATGDLLLANATTGEAATTLAPGAAEVVLDAFTLTASAGTANPSSLTVTMPAGSAALIETLTVENTSACNQATPYGTVTNPGSDTPAIGVSGLSVGTSAVPLWICVKPKTHANMPAVPGTEVAVTGRVTTVVAAGFTQAGSDTVGLARTIDNLSPSPAISGLGGTPGGGQVTVAWTGEPTSADFLLGGEVVVLVRAGSAPTESPAEGTDYTGSGAETIGSSTVGCVAMPGVKTCVVDGLSAATDHYFTAFARDVNGNYSVTSGAAGPFQPTSYVGEGDTADGSAKPAVSITNPGASPTGAALPVGLPLRVQARVYSPSGNVGTVQLLVDEVPYGTNLSPSAFYGTTTTSGVWQVTVDALAPGEHTLVVTASNAAGTVRSRRVKVNYSTTKGDGNLLVRDNASQLCSDCHAPMKTHSSETTSNAKGSWSLACRDCHTPHSTTNLGLIRQRIQPPSYTQDEPLRDVVFRSRTAGEVGGPANAANNGVCQVCHTQTIYYTQGGGGTGHETGSDCLGCHNHTQGLKGTCTSCHGTAGRGSALGALADSNIDAAPPLLVGPSTPTPNPSPAGQVTSGNGHLLHLDFANFRTDPIKCADCHTTYSHKDGNADVAWGTLASSNSFVPTPATGAVASAGWPAAPTCTNWCHGQGLAGGGGPASFDWTSTAALGCSSCHGAPPPVSADADEDHPFSIYCSSCHGDGYIPFNLSATAKDTHINGTINKPANGCTACHGVLAGIAGAAQVGVAPEAAPGQTALAVDTHGNTGRSSVGVGAHIKHVNAGAFMSAKCAECHAVPAANDTTHADAGLDWGWTTTFGVTPNYARPDCTIWCHSNAGPLGGTLATATPAWTSTTTPMGCTSCHATSSFGGTGLSAKHQKHLAGYPYTCDECHTATMDDDSSTVVFTPANHVNGFKNVGFSAIAMSTDSIDQSGGAYAGSPGYTCASTYCHSGGVATASPFSATASGALSWSTGTSGCRSCHGFTSASAPTIGVAAGSSFQGSPNHASHVANAGVIGANYLCGDCHQDTVAAGSDSPITAGGYANHVNGVKNVSIATRGTFVSTEPYTGGQCSATYCHSSGQATPVYRTIAWGAAGIGCNGCHGTGTSTGAPDYADGATLAEANSHASHVSAATDCEHCHTGYVTAAGTAISGANHTNGVRNVGILATYDTNGGTAQDNYNSGTKTCSGVSCHGSGTPVWGDPATATCTSCHTGTGDVNSWNISDGTAARLDTTQWSSYGHGQTSAAFSEFTGATNRCVYCHDDQNASAMHGQSGNPFRLRGAADALGATALYSTSTELTIVAACLNCHAESAAVAYGVDPDGAGGQGKVGPATLRIDATHHAAKHGAANDGGQRCWDCHDVHGDGVNLAMIGSDTLRDGGDVHGLTGTRSTNAAVLTSRAAGGYTNTASPWNGVCQVCHTTTDFWRADGTLQGHNSGTDCVSCHTHQQPPDQAFMGAGACSACHLAPIAAGDQDVEDYTYNNGTKAMVDGDDWASYGHGATAAFAQSGNAAPAFPVNTTVEGCYYCHAPDTAIPGGTGDTSAHGDAADPFRLTNTGGADGKNGVCLVCHKAGSTGFDPDGANAVFTSAKSATSKIGATHYGADHTGTGDGGMYCWDCHDPHGDYNYTVGTARAIAFMIHEQPTRDHSGATGWGVPTALAAAVDFNKAAGSDGANFDAGDYVDTVASTYNGVCQVCHTATKFWWSNGTLTTHMATGARCVSCHAHEQPTTSAFLDVPGTNCGGCHNSPPTVGRHTVHIANIQATPVYGSTTNNPSTTVYGYQCGMCHTTSTANHYDDQGGTAADPFQTDVAFTWGSVLTYTPGATPTTETGPTGLVFRGTNGSCQTIYCHDPQGATYPSTNVTWTQAAGTLACTDCHDDAFNLTATTLPGAHDMHSLATGSGGYAYSCEKCHANTVSSASAISDKTQHADNDKNDVKFSTSPIDQTAGTFSGGTSGTCSNTYCHSNGQDLVAPFTSGPSIAWDGTKSCTSCHGGGGGASTTLSDSHHLHVDAVASDGYGHTCDQCHANTGNNTSISNKANHVDADASHDVAFNAVPITQTGGTYDTAGKTCSNTYCHSNGQDTASPFTSGPSAAWGATAGCTSCHGGGAAATTTLSTSHAKHVTTASGSYNYTCEKCHTPTVSDSATISTKANHVDADTTTHDVDFSTWPLDQSAGTYAVAGMTCSNTYCHSNGQDRVAPFTSGPSIAWGTTADTQCDSCHGGNATATATTGVGPLTSNDHAAHMNQAAYLGTNFECAECHNATVSAGNDRAITNLANHVDGAEDISILNGGTYGGAATKQCSSTYCHSNGTETLTAGEYVTVDWDAGTALTNDCKQCHGRDVGSIAGAPWYTNSTASNDTRNSHPAHVAAATDCVDCHAGTVNASGGLLAGVAHLNKLVEVSGAAIGSYTDGTETCNTVTCHGGASPQWGGTLDCTGCHLGAVSGTTETELDDYNYGNGTVAKLDPEDWIGYGHGRPTASGAYDSGNPAAGFDTAAAASTDDGCKYCHDKTVPHGQFGVSANPFRLANVGSGNTVALKNGVCTVCHGGAGYLGKTATTAITAYHYGAQHTSDGTFGGQLCWDCHDPHGDYRYTSANGGASETPLVTANEVLGFMIDAKLVASHPTADGNSTEWGTNGTTGPTIAAKSPRFNKSLVTPTTSYDWGDYALNNTAPNAYNGVCQACHTGTTRFLASGTTWTNDQAHNTGQGCALSCHQHQQPPNFAFKGKGSCLGCHAARTGAIPRASVVGGTAGNEGDDFIRASRHVSNGTTTSIVTDYDCILCHAEGDLSSTGSGATADIKAIAANHGADGGTNTVDLRNVDSAGGTGVAAAWPGRRLATFTANTAQRDAMDAFCLNCHDANGASTVAVNKNNPANGMLYSGTTVPTLAQAQKPFNVNDNLRNVNDAAALGTWRTTTNGKIIDVKGQFNTGNATGKNWASHHNLNAYTKRYSTNNNTYLRFATFTTYVTKEGVTLNSATGGTIAGLHCSDCHLNEVNAHGTRASWYMLSSSTGTDASFNNSGLTTSTDVCSRCHSPAVYGKTAGTNSRTGAHDGDCGRVDSAGGEYSNSGAILGRNTTGAKGEIACLMCHGGLSPGMIHGTNGSYNPYNGATASKMYRFMGTGGSMRWYSPVGATTYTGETQWEGTGTYGCYTLSAADTFGGCTQHNAGRAGSAQNYTRPLQY